jgi:hypothetical protein
MAPRVVNVRDYPYEKGVGFVLPANVRLIDRTTKFGNHYRIGEDYEVSPGQWRRLTRDDVLDLYGHWLADALADDPTFLDELEGCDLACHCPPLRCHGDVILEFMEAQLRPFPVTDDELDAPDGAVVDGFVRVGDSWEPVSPY